MKVDLQCTNSAVEESHGMTSLILMESHNGGVWSDCLPNTSGIKLTSPWWLMEWGQPTSYTNYGIKPTQRLVYTRAEESWVKLENWFVLLWRNFHALLSSRLRQPCSAQKFLRSGGNCSAELSPNFVLSRHGVEVHRGYNPGRWCFYAFAIIGVLVQIWSGLEWVRYSRDIWLVFLWC